MNRAGAGAVTVPRKSPRRDLPPGSRAEVAIPSRPGPKMRLHTGEAIDAPLIDADTAGRATIIGRGGTGRVSMGSAVGPGWHRRDRPAPPSPSPGPGPVGPPVAVGAVTLSVLPAGWACCARSVAGCCCRVLLPHLSPGRPRVQPTHVRRPVGA